LILAVSTIPPRIDKLKSSRHAQVSHWHRRGTKTSSISCFFKLLYFNILVIL
jgi:hypothetical protein